MAFNTNGNTFGAKTVYHNYFAAGVYTAPNEQGFPPPPPVFDGWITNLNQPMITNLSQRIVFRPA